MSIKEKIESGEGITVFSAFDGMACARIALQELGVPIEKYYASEVDKRAMYVANLNFPDIVQLGDIERWREWNVDWSSIDLFCGGSPCTGFSIIGKRLAFDDPQSRLFFVFWEIWCHIKECNPKAKVLLENVSMKKEHLDKISQHMGMFPININSSLVSAQNRDRYYWTNIRATPRSEVFGDLYCDIPQPKNRGLLFKDIMEDEVAEKYYITDEYFEHQAKKKIAKQSKGLGFGTVIKGKDDILPTCLSRTPSRSGELLIHINSSDSSNTDKSSVVSGRIRLFKDDAETFRVIKSGKVGALTKRGGPTGNAPTACCVGGRYRFLTPRESARAQTIPDWYQWGTSPDNAIYKACGNGWTVEVIKHIFQYLTTGY